MAQISPVTTWASGQVLTAAALDAEFLNGYTNWNNHDSGSSAWTNVKGATIEATTLLKGKGTTTNDTATTGYVGETTSASITSSTNFPATTVWGDLTSVSLTAGDWLVSTHVWSTLNGATCTSVESGISATSGNSTAGLQLGDNRFSTNPPTATADQSMAIPSYRVSLAATTTYYLKYKATFSAGTPQAQGRISAVRIR